MVKPMLKSKQNNEITTQSRIHAHRIIYGYIVGYYSIKNTTTNTHSLCIALWCPRHSIAYAYTNTTNAIKQYNNRRTAIEKLANIENRNV